MYHSYEGHIIKNIVNTFDIENVLHLYFKSVQAHVSIRSYFQNYRRNECWTKKEVKDTQRALVMILLYQYTGSISCDFTLSNTSLSVLL